jgi:hypothetical protein
MLPLPALLALAAAFLRAYPYGGARVLAYAAPGLFLVAAVGMTALLGCLRWHVAAAVVAGALVLPPAGRAVAKVIAPWPRADIASAAAVVRQRFEAHDRVLTNEIVSRYYFRDALDRYVPLKPGDNLERFFETENTRLWLILSAEDPHERARLAGLVTPRCRVVQHLRFEFTDVYLIEKRVEIAACGLAGRRGRVR